MRTAETLPCPDCGAPLTPGAPTCASCGLRLVGPEAARLWQVRQQIGVLQGEADHLLRLLRTPLGTGPGVGAGPAQPVPGAPVPPAVHPGQWQHQPSRGISGQQILLGLGALLLLSAASFFLLVVWFAVGLVGQAAIMVALTATAVGGAALATHFRLPAAAETAAVIASGFVLLDLWAAHRLGLAGLDSLPGDRYWMVAGLIGAGLLLGADRVLPRSRAGEPLRPVWVFRPVAAAFVALSGWAALSALTGLAGPDSEELLLSALALGLAALCALAAGAAYRLDRSPARTGAVPWSSLPLLVSGALALLVHLLAGLAAGYDPSSSAAVRYGSVLVLLVVPVAAFLATARPRPVPVPAARAGDLRTAAVLWLVPVLGIVLVDLHRGLLAGVAVLVAGLLVAEHLRVLRLPAGAWLQLARAVLWVLLPGLTLVVLFMAEDGAASLRSIAADLPRVGEASWVLPVVPAAAWAAAAAVPAVVGLRRRAGAGWLAWALLAASALLWVALRDTDAVVWAVLGLVAYSGCLALGAALAGRDPEPEPRSRPRLAAEVPAVGFAVLHALVAVVAAGAEDSVLQGVALVAVGLLALAYAAVPGRLAGGYVGTFVTAAGVSTLLDEAGVGAVEVHALTPTVLLSALGVVLWHRDPRSRTVLTMGPALVMALGPSLLVGIAEGGALRLAGVSLVAVLVLLLGLSRRWQAPVLVGAGALALVAVTQGGPYLAYVSGWILLGVTGTIVLGIGVAWEQAIQAGRRTTAWFSHLR